MSEKAILIVWDRMGDYHLARIKACRELIGPKVYSADLGSADTLYQWNNVSDSKHFVLSDKPVHQKDFIQRFLHFRKILSEKHITHIAMGYGRTEYIFFLVFARLTGIKTIVFCESWYERNSIKDFLKSCMLKVIGTFFFVSGERAFNHFVYRYRIRPAKVFKGYSVVDNKHFQAIEEKDKRYLLCVARYSEEKNLNFLIQCFAQSIIITKYELLIIGDGPLKEKLKKQIEDLKTDHIILSDWKNYKELPGIYAGAIACILPSTFEPWGLVINEAMAASLPVLISDDCGCKPDLLDEGENGWSFNSMDEKDLIRVLDIVATNNIHSITNMGSKSESIIRGYSPESWARNINHFVSLN